MITDSYRARQDILHDLVIHIEDLSKENAALILSLHAAEAEVGRLKIEIVQLEDGHIVLTVKLEAANKEITQLTVKLEDANNEIGRLGMVLHHQDDNLNSIQMLGKKQE